MTSLSYTFNSDDGSIQSISTGFQGNDGKFSNVSASIVISQEDLPEGKTFDNLTRADIAQIGKQKLAKLTAVTQ